MKDTPPLEHVMNVSDLKSIIEEYAEAKAAQIVAQTLFEGENDRLMGEGVPFVEIVRQTGHLEQAASTSQEVLEDVRVRLDTAIKAVEDHPDSEWQRRSQEAIRSIGVYNGWTGIEPESERDCGSTKQRYLLEACSVLRTGDPRGYRG